MAIIMVDSHVLTWAIKEKSSAGQEHKIKHAQFLLHDLDQKGHQVVISTIVVSELLRDVEIDKQLELYDIIQKHFLILPFCNRSALECARITKLHDEAFKKEDLKDKHSNSAVKADWMILATALVYNVNTLFSEDRPLQNMVSISNAKINIEPIPEPIQEDLFDPFFNTD
jgi:predicted nucleic acid-binding protein